MVTRSLAAFVIFTFAQHTFIQNLDAQNSVSATNLRHRVPKEARKAYERGVKNANQDHRAGVEAAAADLERAILIDPSFAEAHWKLGFVYFRLARLHESDTEFRRAIELNPTVAQWHASLGWSLFGLGDDGGAAQCAKRALDLDPDNSSAHILAGALLAASPGKRLESLWHLAEGADSMKTVK